jgi:hypothetical protein
MGPSTEAFIASDFPEPDATSNSSLESIIVPTPIVIAYLGTTSSASKNLLLASRVVDVKVLILVLEPSDDPGSLNAICQFAPIPRI